jgi:phage-related protein
MSTFSYLPDFSAQRTVKPRVRAVRFGDGYEQRTADGINTQPALWSLTFNNRTTAEADTIETFFSTQAGMNAFDWTPPLGSAGRFICREWNRTMPAYGVNAITCNFEQVFE